MLCCEIYDKYINSVLYDRTHKQEYADKYIVHNHAEQVIEHILYILGIDNLNFISDIEREIIVNSAEIQAKAIEE